MTTRAMGGRIVVVGSVNRDHVLNVDRRPAPGETVTGARLSLHAGGKGANQAVAAARLEGKVVLVGRVGDDAAGSEMLEALRRAGVDTSLVGVEADTTTGAAYITVTPDGENAIIVAPGANQAVTADVVEDAAAALASAMVVLMQQEVPEEAVECAVRAAGDDALMVLNAAPARAVPREVLERLDALIVNEHEAAVLLALGAADASTAPKYARPSPRAGSSGAALGTGAPGAVARGIDAARALLAMGPRAAIVTLGADGAVVAEDDGCYHLAAPQVEVADTTGAGDAFAGAFAQALAVGASLRQAAARGVLAGAAAVTRAGAQDSFPTLAELERRAGGEPPEQPPRSGR